MYTFFWSSQTAGQNGHLQKGKVPKLLVYQRALSLVVKLNALDP